MSLAITATDTHRLVSHAAGRDLCFVHLTLIVDRPVESESDLAPLLDSLAAEIAGRRLLLLQEKMYGETGFAPSATSSWRGALARAGLEADSPLTYVGNRPCVGGAVAGIQVAGVARGSQRGLSALLLRRDGRPVGRAVEGDGLRIAWLSSITGHDPEGRTAAAPAQMEAMFDRAVCRVEELGFSYRNVARTWIHVDALLDHYDDLNRTRAAAYSKVGLIPPDAPPSLPASTGIQGAHPAGAECLMDLVMFAGGDDREPMHRLMRTPHQCEAYAYGSSFARGATVQLADVRLLYASGTASIDDKGNTVHVGDPAGQVRETYSAVSDLLVAQSASLEDVVTGVAFSKNEATYRALEELEARREIPELPVIPVYGDVCRDDLLFELEPTAVDCP